MINAEAVQTPSDRFLKWMKNFTMMIQESAERKPNSPSWRMLLQELQTLQHAFTHMLLSDQITAVSHFEVGSSIKYDIDESKKLIPTEVEVITAQFPAPFLTEVFKLMWNHIVEAEIEPLVLLELKRATHHSAPGPWVRVDRLSDRGNYAVTSLVHRHGQCEICHEPARTPFGACWYCSAHPCYHHGRCCPSRRLPRVRVEGRDLPIPGQPLL